MGFLSDIFNRGGRVVRGQANAGMSAVEDATFEATVKQTVADMRTGPFCVIAATPCTIRSARSNRPTRAAVLESARPLCPSFISSRSAPI